MTIGAHHGHYASGARIQARSAFGGIGDTVAIGRVLYDSGFPIVVPIGDIHIFIGETDPTPATETNF
jgi:hypothetical protein